MSTLEDTISMLETMSEESRSPGSKYTKPSFMASEPANPFTPKTKKDILEDLAESGKQISEGGGVDMKQALQEMGEKHGFI